MRLKKAERGALANLLEQGADSPEALAEDFVKLLDQLRGERSYHYACAIVAGFPLTIGPYSTKAQAKKAIESLGAEKTWIVTGWTEEGWLRHLAEVDAPPKPHELSAAEQRKLEKGFWAKVRQIEDGEATALVLKGRQDVEIKPFRHTKGVW